VVAVRFDLFKRRLYALLTSKDFVHPNRAVEAFRRSCGTENLIDDYVLMIVLMRACDEEPLMNPEPLPEGKMLPLFAHKYCEIPLADI